MRRFCRTLDACQIDELYLHGRLFTWSNERRRPTFEGLDRAFASVRRAVCKAAFSLRGLLGKARRLRACGQASLGLQRGHRRRMQGSGLQAPEDSQGTQEPERVEYW
jgi:hypothetical protein